MPRCMWLLALSASDKLLRSASANLPLDESPHARSVLPGELLHIKNVIKVLSEVFEPSVAKLLEPLQDLAFLPCLPPSTSGECAAMLFRPQHASLESEQGHQKLQPIFGIVDPDARRLAKQIGVQERPRVANLVDAIPKFGAVKAVVLCIELASRLEKCKDVDHSQELANLKVPTNTGDFLPPVDVYINDAPWTGSETVFSLDDRISHEYGRQLGCTSIRDRLAQECEDNLDEEDAFGQEADLVDQVKLILKDYSSQSDVVAEFFQNTDDFGASKLEFFLFDEAYDKEEVVDQRSGALQGPALYICSSKPLKDEDIKQMQRIGRSAKNLDFASTGRFGIGMNVMYRYSDCPQLLANGSLHFFDLMRKFVARNDGKRGRQFKIEKLEEFFPDSIAPFEGLMDQYPVVFRLPLRTCKSELGEGVELSSVQDDLRIADSQAPTMLLFAKWIKQISFQGLGGMIGDHKACIDAEAEERAHQDFFTSLPRKLEEISEGEDKKLCVKKRIISQSVQSGTENVFERSWVIVHTLAPCLE